MGRGCGGCGGVEVMKGGLGREKIEDEMKEIFGEGKVGGMDLDRRGRGRG